MGRETLTPHEHSVLLRGVLLVSSMILGAVILFSVFVMFEYSGLSGQ